MTGRSVTFGLLALLVAAMPWDDALQRPSATVSVVKLLGALVAVAWLATMAGRTPLVLAPTLVPLAVFAVLAVASLVASGDIGRGLPHLLRYGSFVALFFLVTQIVRSRSQIVVLLGVLTASAAIASAVGVGRFVAGVADRASGPIADANDFAYVLAAVLPFGAYLAARGGRWRPAWVLATGVIAVGALATLSRGAIVGLVAAGAWAALAGRVRPRVVVLTVLALGLLAGAAFAVQRDFVEDRLQAKSLVAGDNIESRRALWAGALEMAVDHPVLGVGTGLYRYRAAEYVTDDPLHIVEPVAHNAYLEVLAENGILATLALAAFVVGTWLLVRTSYLDAVAAGDHEDAQLATALQASTIVAVVGAVFLSVLVTPPLWFVGALIASLAAMTSQRATEAALT